MANDRLRDVMLRNGLTPSAIAEQVGVDPKTVERWITQDRTPYPRHRHAIAALLRESEAYLWPTALSPERAMRVAQSEVVELYPRRSGVPAELWRRLLHDASKRIRILVFSGLFLPEHFPRLVPTLRDKAEADVKVQILLGHPDSPQVGTRGSEEGIGEAMASKIRNVLSFYEGLKGVPRVSVRFHGTTLYNSIYWFDDEMLVNTHVYGFPAAHAPVLHLRRLAGGDFFDTYADSFERVWTSATEEWPDQRPKVNRWRELSTTTTR